MRLLNVTTKKLHTFSSDETPPYAILSHTWGPEEEEVTFAQIQHPEQCFNIAGYKKIELICYQAANDNLEFAWVDTCCIDKSSSSELSESINSMFRWYKNSVKCYAYLVDVDLISGGDYLLSRWWSRSWTLQELLAPQRVEFFDKRWRLIGGKQELSPQISVKTGIDVSFIEHSYNLQYASVAERMVWASSRQASRVEDIAYSLLGIFNVSLSLRYGEKQKAFFRLQKEIMNNTADLSLFTWGISHRTLLEAVKDQPKDQALNNSKYGMFAETPAQFKGCERVYFTPARELASGCTMANGILQMELPLLLLSPIQSDPPAAWYLGLLPCSLKGSSHHCLGILLNRETSSNKPATRVCLSSQYSTFIVGYKHMAAAKVQIIRIMDDSGYPNNTSLWDSNNYGVVINAKYLGQIGYQFIAVLPDVWEWNENESTAVLRQDAGLLFLLMEYAYEGCYYDIDEDNDTAREEMERRLASAKSEQDKARTATERMAFAFFSASKQEILYIHIGINMPRHFWLKFEVNETKIFSTPAIDIDNCSTFNKMFGAFTSSTTKDMQPFWDMVISRDFKEIFNHQIWVLNLKARE